MALLTADDVLNKTFQSVKFREGYDQVEVDEFLDEVVATIYAITVENSELKEQLAAAEGRIAELQSGAPVVTEVVEDTVVADVAPVEEVTEEPAPVAVEPAAPQASGDPQAATAMLSLAQRLHDEYVNDGKNEGERIVADARQQGQQIVSDANAQRDEILARLNGEKSELEDSINNLRSFEAEYRSSISEHLEKLLADLKSDSSN